MAVRTELFGQVVDLFCEAAALPALWPTALARLADACGGRGAVVNSSLSGSEGPICSAAVEEVMQRHILDGWQERNTRLQRGMRLFQRGHRGLITETDLFTPEEWRVDPLLNELALPHGFSSFGGLILARIGDDVLPISIERATRQEPFTRGEVATINQLLALLHPAGALALRAGLSAAASVADALAQSGDAIFLIGENAGVLHERRGSGAALDDLMVLRGHRLHVLDPVSDRLVQAAIHRAVARAPSIERIQATIPLRRASGGRPANLTVVPLVGAAHDVFMLARAIVIVSDGRPSPLPRTALDQLAMLWGLTPAEARLAAQIASGEDLRQIAGAERTTFETIRTRLKTVFAKTGTHRQVELAIVIRATLRG